MLIQLLFVDLEKNNVKQDTRKNYWNFNFYQEEGRNIKKEYYVVHISF